MYKTIGERCLEELLSVVENEKKVKKVISSYSKTALNRTRELCSDMHKALFVKQQETFDERREDKMLQLQKCDLIINKELNYREFDSKTRKVKQEVEPKTIKTTAETFKKGKKYRVKTWDELLENDENFIDNAGDISNNESGTWFVKSIKIIANTIFEVKEEKESVWISGWYVKLWMCEEVEEVQPLEEFEIGKEYEILTYNELLKVKGVKEIRRNTLFHQKTKCKYYTKTMDEIIDRIIFPVYKEIYLRDGWVIEPWMCREVESITLEEASKLERTVGEFKNPNAEYVSADLESVEPEEKGTSTVNHPQHYNVGSIETIDVIEGLGWGRGFNLGNALKYLMRCEHKGKKKEDLEKAMWYIKRELENIEEEK